MSEIINVTRSSIPEFEEYCNEIRSIWDSHWLTNMGEKHQRLEAELKEYLGVQNVALLTNGHLALENIIEAMGLKGEIITTPFTFASTTHAITRIGCTPVFCDINPDDYTIDVTKIESLITDKTVAIMPVHVYGNLCDVDAIDRIAKAHGLHVFYDAAHAFGVRRGGVSSAAFGDVSMFSFHATKVFHTIEGGALCYSDGALEQRLKDLKNFGIHGPESVPFVGGNAKMNEFCAAMGLCNLRHLDAEIAKLGLRRKFVRRELFGMIKDPWNQPDYPAEIRGRTFKLTVVQCGEEYDTTASADEPLLVAAERAGIAAPSRCRSGECGWCRSKLLSGRVYVPEKTDGRRMADVEFGYIHPCSSFAMSDIVLEVPNCTLK